MNAEQVTFASGWTGPHDETYFTRLRALEASSAEPEYLADAPPIIEQTTEPPPWLADEPGTLVTHRTGAEAETVPRTHDLGDYLEAVRDFMCRYVAFPSEHEPVAIALWVAHAWLVERFETSPILAVTSAEMRSGKTRTLDCLEVLVPTPFRVVIPSEAVVYTVLSQRPRPTLLLDEADAIFGPRTAERYEGVRAVLNSGNRTGTPVLRVKLEGKRRDVEAFDVFGPKAIAGIGNLPTTVADRSIPIRLKRRAPSEFVARFRRRTAEAEAASIRLDAEAVTVVMDIPVPEELPDRAADSWEVLLSIADAAGGLWPTMGRLAAVALSGEDETPVSVGMRLLADVRDAFGDDAHLGTGELLTALHGMDDAPWADWYGAPLSARGLAKLLGPYRVTPVLRRVRGERHRGYFAADFGDAWARYVPVSASAPVPSVTSVTPAEPVEPSAADAADNGDGWDNDLRSHTNGSPPLWPVPDDDDDRGAEDDDPGDGAVLVELPDPGDVPPEPDYLTLARDLFRDVLLDPELPA